MPIKILADEDFNALILKGIRQRIGNPDILTVVEIGLRSAKDPDVLEWAAVNDRIVVAHDARTLIGFANHRIKNGQPMPGVLHVPQLMPIRDAIDDLLIVIECAEPADFENQIRYLPL